MIPDDVTLPEMLAYLHKTLDSEALGDLLRQIQTARSSRCCRQSFESVAEELATVGLGSAASYVQTFAETLPHRWELPYTPTGVADEHWHRGVMAKSKAEWEAKQARKKKEKALRASRRSD